jgi:predicted NBD/HSP70 family sugar kinase
MWSDAGVSSPLERSDRPEAGPGSPSSLRTANERRVLDALKESGEITQAELARRTELAPSTVSNIIQVFRADGLVAAGDSHGGRRGQLVRFLGAAGFVVGVDVGHRHLRVALADLSHAIVAESVEPLERGHRAEDVMTRTRRLTDDLLAGTDTPRSQLLAAGMAIPAPINREGTLVSARAVLPGWADRDLPTLAARTLGLPVVVENDANLGALAESRWGAGRGHENVAYVKLAAGVGAGLILDGRLFRGATGAVGEIGHATIDERGPFCRCGNRGCLETYVAADRVLALLADTHGADLDVAGLIAKARAGDVACQRALADTGRTVGIAVANLCNIINPSIVVVGGELASAGDLLIGPLRETVDRFGVHGAVAQVDVVEGELGAHSHVLGAVAVAIDSAPLVMRS